ncbi:hypothetical protein K7X08_019940 [Anisodus acutangulus]|uniref:JmjC domain-containing protein n=1 Tax=Anisodus acutangulus TaxID=402998 RepID=A0A9Q1RPZ8_9SOLA|nr:hypothetical protein K7X08_019940 [Anisodus acutangulus]
MGNATNSENCYLDGNSEGQRKRRKAREVVHPIHDQVFYLTAYHKKKLKQEFGIEPWTFVQKLGEAVFIPAGCPHQVRNLKVKKMALYALEKAVADLKELECNVRNQVHQPHLSSLVQYKEWVE